MKITVKTVNSLQPKDRPYEVYDDALKGFVLRIQPSNVKTYYYSYRLPSGKRTRYRIGRNGTISAVQARDMAQKIAARVISGEDVNATRKKEREAGRQRDARTLRAFLAQHYAPWAEAHLRTGSAIVQRIRTNFGDLMDSPMDEVSQWLIEKWRSQRLKAGIQPATVNRDAAALRACLQRAVDWGVIAAHPLTGLKPLRTDRKTKVRFLTKDEEGRLRQALIDREQKKRKERESANAWRRQRAYEELPDLNEGYVDYLRPLVLLALNTGLRRGELLALEWKDIDFEHQVVIVRGHKAKSGQTRQVPLNEESQTVLHSLCSENASGLVFNREGRGLTHFRRSWNGVLKEAGIENFRFHDLRHTFATKIILSGVDVATLRDLLGHADLTTTDRYTHVDDKRKRQAVSRLGAETPKKQKAVLLIGGISPRQPKTEDA